MNKKVITFIICFLAFLFNVSNTFAATNAKTIASNLSFRTGPTTDASRITTIPYNTEISVLDMNVVAGNGCNSGWFKINYNNKTGYVCSKYVTFYVATALAVEREPLNDTERAWKEEGFPSSYWEKLSALKEIHPNYIFKAIKTDIDWNLAIATESILGMSLIQVTDLSSSRVSYISTMNGSYDYVNKKYIVQEGSSWYAADSEVVAYYMDPRNFLNETRLFMFEDLSYDGDFITEEAIKKIFSGNFSYLSDYADEFVVAGKEVHVNPVYLASLVRQELGGGSSITVSGAQFCYPSENSKYPDERGKCYSGFYNFFNYGAGTDKRPVYNSLIYAKNRGWSTPQLAISGGAGLIGKSYILRGQNTSYFKKYNVKPGALSSTYSNQYMTNVQAPYSESSTAYSSYKNMGALEPDSTIPFTFEIPVFKNMPVETVLPTEVRFISGYENTVVDLLLSNTIIKNDGLYLRNLTNADTEKLKSYISAAAETANVIIFDSAGNAKENAKLVTGDRVNITYDGESQQYKVVIPGDTSNDGEINIIDLLQIQKHLLNATLLDDAYYQAADIDQNNNVDILDLLKVQKHILGDSLINS